MMNYYNPFQIQYAQIQKKSEEKLCFEVADVRKHLACTKEIKKCNKKFWEEIITYFPFTTY
jgi:hypothetical protein